MHESEAQRLGGGKQTETHARGALQNVFALGPPGTAACLRNPPEIGTQRFAKSLFPAAKNPACGNFGHAPLIRGQPSVHQLLRADNVKPSSVLLKEPFA